MTLQIIVFSSILNLFSLIEFKLQMKLESVLFQEVFINLETLLILKVLTPG